MERHGLETRKEAAEALKITYQMLYKFLHGVVIESTRRRYLAALEG